MARVELNGFDELRKMLDSLADPEAMAIKAVNKARASAEQAAKSAVSAAMKGSGISSELVASIKASEVRINQWGVYSAIRPTGKDSNGLRNGEKLAYLHYGVRNGYRGRQQEATYVMDKAEMQAATKCEEIMRQVISEEVDKICR